MGPAAAYTSPVALDPDTCWRALAARDARFDGVFFVGVQTTGIYCRPVCSARTPGRDRCAFYARAVEAERDGFRACFKCRPELAPGNAPVDSLSRLVAAAVSRIEGGFLEERSVADLATDLRVTARHLRRALVSELGVSPVELALSRRMALAKQLVEDTTLPMAEVAHASGFGSVRRFNATFRERFGRAPSELRRGGRSSRGGSLALRLDYRPPLDWNAMLAFVAAHAVPGVEIVRADAYVRTVRLGARVGWLSVSPSPGRDALRAEVSLSLAPELLAIAARLRALFDLDAHPAAIADHLARDPGLAALVARSPGVRVAGAFDGFEIATRAVLGQQVSVRAATTLSRRLVERLGEPVETPFPELVRSFPTPETVAGAGEETIAALGMPRSRARTLIAVARAVANGEVRLAPGTDVDDAVARLVALPGVGGWTSQYVAMRALAWPDAFPPGDAGLRRALGLSRPREIATRAERWRPWRSYAAMHLWASL